MLSPVPGLDLAKPAFDLHPLSVRSGRHVAVSERVREQPARGDELCGQFTGEPAVLRLVGRARVVSDQGAQDRIGVVLVSEVASAIERVEAGYDQFR